MKTTIELPDTIAACHAMIIDMARQIEQLKRRVFGSLKDRAVKYEGPSLFDGINEEEAKAAALELEKATREVEEEAEKRRAEAKRQRETKRPGKYNTYGLPEVRRTCYPEGVNPEDYDVIGSDTVRVLHLEPQKLWVEETVYPVLRKKTDKNMPYPRIVQAQRPKSIIGGGHVGADLLATLIDNKFNHHLPEYR